MAPSGAFGADGNRETTMVPTGLYEGKTLEEAKAIAASWFKSGAPPAPAGVLMAAGGTAEAPADPTHLPPEMYDPSAGVGGMGAMGARGVRNPEATGLSDYDSGHTAVTLSTLFNKPVPRVSPGGIAPGGPVPGGVVPLTPEQLRAEAARVAEAARIEEERKAAAEAETARIEAERNAALPVTTGFASGANGNGSDTAWWLPKPTGTMHPTFTFNPPAAFTVSEGTAPGMRLPRSYSLPWPFRN